MKDKKKHQADYEKLDGKEEIKRLNRVMGQLEGVRRMIEEQRKLEDILIQCKAVHSALRSVEARLFSVHVESALKEAAALDKKKDRRAQIEQLEVLFKRAEG